MHACVQAVSWSLFGIATQVWMMYVFAALCIFNGIMFPIARAFLAREFGAADYGSALGVLALLQQVASIVAPIVRNAFWLIEMQVHVHGLSFFVFGSFVVVGLVVAIFIKFPRESLASVNLNAGRDSSSSAATHQLPGEAVDGNGDESNSMLDLAGGEFAGVLLKQPLVSTERNEI